MKLLSFTAAAMLALGANQAGATSLVYTPTNPAFGGSPLNGAWLLQQGQAENQHTKSSSSSSATAPLTQSQIFAQQLQSQLYASLANQITQSIFGANAQQSGTFTFQNTTVNFNKVNGQTNITIFDGTTTTSISLPSN
jgi:curli production assembly/transport component CsgF